MIGHGLIAPVMIPTTPPVDKRAGEGGEAGLSPIRLSRELGPEIDVMDCVMTAILQNWG